MATLLRLIFRFFFWVNGWKINIAPGLKEEDIHRCVFLAAPHTTNWDLVYALEAARRMGVRVRFAIKRDWLRFPFSLVMKPLGAIGIDRRPKDKRDAKISMVEAMANLFAQHQRLSLIIPPEGTRSLAKQWKTGFYYVAYTAEVPICCSYLDYDKKEVGIAGIIYPSGDLEADMAKLMDMYRDKGPKFPEKFSLDERYDRR